VNSLHTVSEGKVMGGYMYLQLKEPANPRILFRFSELVLKTMPESKDASYLFDSRCELVLAGVTNQVSIPVSVLPLSGGKLKITGSTSIKFSDFRVRPTISPEVKIWDEVKFRFEWLVGQKPKD
jgi:hypothetical protein